MSPPASPLSRRKFVVALAGTSAVAIGAVSAAPLLRRLSGSARGRAASPSGAAGSAGRPLLYGSYEDWRREIGAIFRTAGGFSIRLTAVTALASPGNRPAHVIRKSGFVASFDVIGGRTAAGNRIHKINHARHGWMDLYMTAPGEGAMGAKLNALLN